MAEHQSNWEPRLRELRLQRAMTQQEVAERLVQLAWLRCNRRVGVNADMVSKWERAEKRPSAFYRRLLCGLFEVSQSQLGLGALGEPMPVLGSASNGFPEHTSELTEVYTALDEMRAPVQLLQPKMLMLWREELLNRRQVLKLMGVAPAAASLESVDTTLQLLPPFQRAVFRGEDTLRQLGELVMHLEGIYHYSDPKRLLLPVRALVETVEDFLPEARRHEVRRRLLGTLARAHLLAGRLTLFDLHEPMRARAHLDLAREASHETGDRVLGATVLGHLAFLPASKHNFTAAASYVADARGSLARKPVPVVSAWLSAVEGELSTNAGAIKPAMKSLARSREELSGSGKTPAPVWFDFFDEQRLSGFEGFTLRRSGDTPAARTALQAALGPAEHSIPKQRAVTSIDLAAVCVDDGDIDEGCRLATDAAMQLHRAGYATAVDRLTEFRNGLPDPKHPAATLLAESISELS